MVDFIECSTYREVDLNANPIIVPACGHHLTFTSMDGHMGMSAFYQMHDDGAVESLIGASSPFSAEDLKGCPMCRLPLRDIHRYSWIVKRGLIDEATKRFIVWANGSFVPLESRLSDQELYLMDVAFTLLPKPRETDARQSAIYDPQELDFRGSPDAQVRQIRHLAGVAPRFDSILGLRSEIRTFLRQVSEAEQPFCKVYQMVKDIRRSTGETVDFLADDSILRVRERLLASSLAIRCDLTILSDFIKIHQSLKGSRGSSYKWTRATVTLDLAQNRQKCLGLAKDAMGQDQPMQEIEARIYFARYVALERVSVLNNLDSMRDLAKEAEDQLSLAKAACTRSRNTKAMLVEVENVEKLMRDSVFYTVTSNEEKRAVYAAMAMEFRGTGHWYSCVHGHPVSSCALENTGNILADCCLKISLL